MSAGIDCSCFVQTIFRSIGIALPRTSQQQYNASVGRGLFINAPEPGDLVFFFRTYFDTTQDWTHVGIVSRVDSNGTVWMINAPGARAASDPSDSPFGRVREEPIAGSWLQHRATYARISVSSFFRSDEGIAEVAAGIRDRTTLAKAALTSRKAGRAQFVAITFTDILVSSYQTTAESPTEVPPTDHVRLNFASAIRWRSTNQERRACLAGPGAGRLLVMRLAVVICEVVAVAFLVALADLSVNLGWKSLPEPGSHDRRHEAARIVEV